MTITNSEIARIKEKNPLYKYCSKEWHSIIDSSQVLSRINKGGIIFAEGEEVKGIYILIKGKVKVISTYDKDKERIHRLAGEGKLLGHRGLTSKLYPISAIALIDSMVIFIPEDIFIKLIKTNPELSIYLVRFLVEELKESEERVKNMMRVDVKRRIAGILLNLVDSFGYDNDKKGKLRYTLSRKDFASMAGTTYETVIRTLVYLQQKKLIKLEGKLIYIKNITGLKNLR